MTKFATASLISVVFFELNLITYQTCPFIGYFLTETDRPTIFESAGTSPWYLLAKWHVAVKSFGNTADKKPRYPIETRTCEKKNRCL